MALAIRAELGELEARVTARLRALSDADVVRRIWGRDHTVWREEPTEISNRLGWLDAPARSRADVAELEAFAADIAGDGFTDAVLLGMGGSSLAPEVITKSFGTPEGMLRLRVLDTTHPDAIALLERDLPLDRTLFVVSSKSGTTIETRSHMAYFLDRIEDASRFVAITDPGTPLEADARRLGFRRVFLAPPDVGGRYSALTVFGLLPAALIGVDLGKLLDEAERAADACRDPDPSRNPGASVGVVLAAAALAGRDKCTFIAEYFLAYTGGGYREPAPPTGLGTWAEQLLAESTGKDGKGIVPVVEPSGRTGVYGDDRLFLSFGTTTDRSPYVELPYGLRYQLGDAFFTLEFATAVAGHVLGIHPFDQPNVQEAKERTAEVLATDNVPEEPVAPLDEVLSLVRPGDYVAIQAFVSPNSVKAQRLRDAQSRIRDRLRVATTLGFGPRYLHSTGQLHKGGPGTGVFVQVFTAPVTDRAIPGQPFTFGQLIAAQAAGDLSALRARGRRVARVTLDDLLAWGG